MKGIVVPDRVEDFTADPVELFFDLAYVFAFSQLVGLLIHDPTWTGVGEVALLFGLLWLPWQQLAWAANAVSGNARSVRLIFLAATAASVPMAAATSTALGAGAEVFAVTLGIIMLLGFAIQALSVERGSALHAAVVRWITPNVIAIVVLLVGAAVGGTGQILLWLLSLAIVLGAMVLAGRGDWLIRTAHMAERHGLIYIVALGEVIVAIGLPVVASLEAGEGVPGRTVAALAASGVFAGLLWWGYFDRVGPALEHRGTEVQGDKARGRYVRDVYTWAHAPIVAGVILSAAALEEITLHPDEPLALSFRMMLAGGLTAMLVGISAAVWRAFHAVARERIVCAAAVFAFLVVASGANGLVLLGVVVAAMAVTLAVEHRRIEA
jgi:low temperature requirement protein LtrA